MDDVSRVDFDWSVGDLGKFSSFILATAPVACVRGSRTTDCSHYGFEIRRIFSYYLSFLHGISKYCKYYKK